MIAASRLLRTGVINPPSPLLPALTLIEQLVRSSGVVAGSEQTSTFEFHDSAESLISILGQRGSGKTTLLAAACASLEQTKSALVVPTIKPEIFDATDSLLLAMLLEIEHWLTEIGDSPKRQSMTEDLGAALATATRTVSASSAGAYHALTSGIESTGQYGVDAVAIMRYRSRLDSSIARLFIALRQFCEVPIETPVVVPIDDADMSPASLRSIISAVRVLGAIQGVVPVICADRQQLEIAALADIHRQYGGHIGNQAADRLAVQVIAKLLRPERCVSPPILPERDRIKFTPIGRDKSIEQLLGEIANRDGAHSPLQALMWKESDLTRNYQPRGVNDWLPETPRELEYLWESISALVESSQQPEPLIRVQNVQRFIDNILASSREYVVSVETAEMSKGRRSQVNPAIRLRWPNINLGIIAESRYATAASTKEFRLRTPSPYRAYCYSISRHRKAEKEH